MAPTDEGARVSRLEGDVASLARELTRHVDDCIRDRQETRRVLEKGQEAREMQHAANDKRLGKIENRLAWLAGVGAAAIFAAEIVAKLVFH